MAPEYRAMSVTAQDYPALFDRLSRWSATRSPELVVASVTTATATGGAGITALVVYADRGHGSVTELVTEGFDGSRRNFGPAVKEYFQRRISEGADPETITGTEVARNTGAAESTARNLLADLKRRHRESGAGQ